MAVKEQMAASEIEHVTAIRHDLHANPELGYEERRTSGVVQRELTQAGIEFVSGLAGGIRRDGVRVGGDHCQAPREHPAAVGRDGTQV